MSFTGTWYVVSSPDFDEMCHMGDTFTFECERRR